MVDKAAAESHASSSRFRSGTSATFWGAKKNNHRTTNTQTRFSQDCPGISGNFVCVCVFSSSPHNKRCRKRHINNFLTPARSRDWSQSTLDCMCLMEMSAAAAGGPRATQPCSSIESLTVDLSSVSTRSTNRHGHKCTHQRCLTLLPVPFLFGPRLRSKECGGGIQSHFAKLLPPRLGASLGQKSDIEILSPVEREGPTKCPT